MPNMPSKKTKNRPLTLNQLADYNQKVFIPALEGVFATKKDLDKFATTEDLKNTEKGLRQEMKKFATKDELKQEVAKLATKEELKKETGMLRFEIRKTRKELKQNIGELGKKVDKTYNQVDKFIGHLKNKEQEEDIRHEQIDRRFEDIEEHVELEHLPL